MRTYMVCATGKEFSVRATAPRQALDIVKNQLSLKAVGKPLREDFDSVTIDWVAACPELSLPGIIEELLGAAYADLPMYRHEEDSLFEQRLDISNKLIKLFQEGKVNFLVLDREHEVPYCGERNGVFEVPVSLELLQEFKKKIAPKAYDRLTGKNDAETEAPEEVSVAAITLDRSTIRWYCVVARRLIGEEITFRSFNLLAISPRQALDIVKDQVSVKAGGKAVRQDFDSLRTNWVPALPELSLPGIVRDATGLTEAEMEALAICEDELYKQRLNVDRTTMEAFSHGSIDYLVMDPDRRKLFCGERDGAFEAPVCSALQERFKEKIKGRQQVKPKANSSDSSASGEDDDSGGVLCLHG